ncbi:MAG: hypothetical protein O7D29_00590, partial [Gemmatimonadetes bacterium]|nr:hypothetical protein [Gemmatimonadota bacterium]
GPSAWPRLRHHRLTLGSIARRLFPPLRRGGRGGAHIHPPAQLLDLHLEFDQALEDELQLPAPTPGAGLSNG